MNRSLIQKKLGGRSGRFGLLVVLALCQAGPARLVATELQILSNQSPQSVFANGTREVTVSFRNPTEQPITADVSVRLQQASSATTAKLSDTPWKKIQVLGGQHIVEIAKVEFPAVKAATRFILQWTEGTNQVLGRTEVMAYPNDLLRELKLLAGNEPVGVFDPQNELKPALKNSAVEFSDLEDVGFDKFFGKLAIVGPFETKGQLPEDFAKRVETLVAKGTAVVWLPPPAPPHSELQPSFYPVSVGAGVAVVVQAALVPHLKENPESQLNLLRCARRAVHPKPLRLPQTSPQP